MGFVYHANYFVWLDMARTEHLRDAGMTYREMEERGVFLTVTDARIRYCRAARYDDPSVVNEADGSDGYAVSKQKFEAMYEPADAVPGDTAESA